MIKKYQQLIIYTGCFFLMILFCIFATDLNARVTPDTNDYINISKDWFDSKAVDIRPLGYPAFIWFCNKVFGENWF